MTTPVVLLILFTILATIFTCWLLIIILPGIDKDKMRLQFVAWRRRIKL